jgi:tetratricopeptide (TPR) repeat protein
LLIWDSTDVLFLDSEFCTSATHAQAAFFAEETAAHILNAILRECAIVVFLFAESGVHERIGPPLNVSLSLTLVFAGISSCRASGSWPILAGCLFASLLLCSQAQAAQVPSNTAGPYYEQGVQLLRQQQWKSASSSFQEALKLDRRLAGAENDLCVALGNLGDQKNSVAAFRRAIEIDPGYSDARYNLALWLQVSGDADQALSELTPASN